MTLTIRRRVCALKPEVLDAVVSIRSDGRFLRCDQEFSRGEFRIHHTFLLSDVAELQLSEP